jgi:dTMP kinase
MNRGKLIVLEGPAGSGKSTQAKILLQKLEAAHLTAKIFSYPDISNNLIARSINRMKNNPDYDLSHASRVLLDAVTSSETMKTINQALIDGIYCICESSYISTIVKYCYLKNLDNYEDIVSVMSYANMAAKPDLTIVFDAPPKTLIDRKYLSEADNSISIEEMEKIRTGYLLEAKNHGYIIIFSTDSIDSISNLVWDQVALCLAVRTTKLRAETESMPSSISEILNYKTEPVLSSISTKIEENMILTDADLTTETSSQDFIDSVLKTTNNVYGFKDRLDILPIASSLAKSKDNDLKNILVQEFDAQQNNGLKIFKSAIDTYGIDKIKKLSFHYLVIDDLSDLLVRKIQSQLIGFSIERQATIYKNYFVPKELDEKTKKEYKHTLNKIYENYSVIVDKLIKYLNKSTKASKLEKINNEIKAKKIAENLLPLATKSSIVLFESNQTIENLIKYLLRDSSIEAQSVGKQILSNMKQVDPMFFANISNLNPHNSKTANVDILKQKLQNGFSSDSDTIKLVDYYPKNEIDLVPYLIYERSELSINELRNEVSKLSYEEKNQIFESHIANRAKTDFILEAVRYSFDIICENNTLRQLLNNKLIKNLTWQDSTPRYGYEIPKIIEVADLVDEYEECFDLSLKLYSQMKLKNYDYQSQYVTLFGHRMRLHLNLSAKEARLFIDSANTESDEYINIISLIKEKLAEIHPLITSLFINQNTKLKTKKKLSENDITIQKSK